MWFLTIRRRKGYLAVVADSGETPTWPDLAAAVAAMQQLDLPRSVVQRVLPGMRLHEPTPYVERMTFDVARQEAEHWR
jgi:hypothetical protein